MNYAGDSSPRLGGNLPSVTRFARHCAAEIPGAINGGAARKDVQQGHRSKPRAAADLLGGIPMRPAGVESRPCHLL